MLHKSFVCVPGDEESDAQPSTSVTRLSAEDIDLYGFCPERDTFYGVVCEICNAIVKPQALIQHMGMCFSIIILTINL